MRGADICLRIAYLTKNEGESAVENKEETEMIGIEKKETEENKTEGNEKVCPCCCGSKTTERSKEDQKKLLNRLNRIEGQIRGIKGMIERDAYCNDILIQSAAVNAAVNAFNRELLSNHIHSCVARDIREGKDETIDELVATLQRFMK